MTRVAIAIDIAHKYDMIRICGITMPLEAWLNAAKEYCMARAIVVDAEPFDTALHKRVLP